jgi:hypothetical protein
MSDTMTDTPGTAREGEASTIGKTVESVAVDLKNAAGQKLEEARAALQTQAGEVKNAVAGEVGNVAAALRRAADDLRGGSVVEASIGMVANTLADASEAVRNKSFDDLMRSAGKVARDNPMLFFGGAMLLGFAVSRFAKATSDLPPHLLSRDARYRRAEDNFISEGNPNTDPPDSMP